MKLRMEVGLGLRQIVLNWVSAPLPKRHSPSHKFSAMSVVAKRLAGSRCSLVRDRPRPRPHCVRWAPSSPSPKGAHCQFSAYACCGQTARWIKMPLDCEVGLHWLHCVRWGPSSPSPKGHSPPPKRNWPMFVVAKRLDGSRCNLLRR